MPGKSKPNAISQRMARHVDLLWHKCNFGDMTLDEMYNRLIAFPTLAQQRDFAEYHIRLDRHACRDCNMVRLRYFLRNYKEDGVRPFHYVPRNVKGRGNERQERGGYWVHMKGIAYLASTGRMPLARVLADLDRLATILNKQGNSALATAKAVVALRTELGAGLSFEQPYLLGTGTDEQPELIAG